MLKTYPLFQSILQRQAIYQYAIENFPGAFISFRAWVSWDFITSPQSSDPLTAGISNAILGSLFTILFAMVFAIPIGIGAAIYLEEYARDNWVNRLIRTNINNLAGVPSVIYGILGLAIFVRVMEPITSGAIFGILRSGDCQWTHDIICRADPGAAGAAVGDYQRTGSGPVGAAILAGSQLRAGRHQVADRLAPCAAQCHPRHADRHHPGDVTCHRRDGSLDPDRCFYLYHL